MQIYIENPVYSTKKLLDLINKFSRVAEYKSNTWHGKKKLNILQIIGSTYCVYRLEELTSLKYPQYPKQSINSTQFILKSNDIFHRSKKNIPKIYMEPKKTPDSLSNLEKEEQIWMYHNT